jgi:hypothetical protein
VKYTTPDRQIAAENNWGRLELEYSVARGLALSLLAWNLKSPKDTWQSNGSISSLLDLWGAQLIVATMLVTGSDPSAISEYSRNAMTTAGSTQSGEAGKR